MKTKRILTTLFAASAAAALAVLFCGSPLLARFGSRPMRQVILSRWVDQHSRLSGLQKCILFSLLYKDVHDPDAAGMALSVLKAHLREDEDEIVRHLVYVALTTKNPYDCDMALRGLRLVEPRHKGIALATFLYELNHSDPQVRANWQKLTTSIGGLAEYSCVEALPTIRQFTNHPSKYLAATAEQAVEILQKSVRSESP